MRRSGACGCWPRLWRQPLQSFEVIVLFCLAELRIKEIFRLIMWTEGAALRAYLTLNPNNDTSTQRGAICIDDGKSTGLCNTAKPKTRAELWHVQAPRQQWALDYRLKANEGCGCVLYNSPRLLSNHSHAMRTLTTPRDASVQFEHQHRQNRLL